MDVAELRQNLYYELYRANHHYMEGDGCRNRKGLGDT